MKIKPLPSQERLQELFDYNKDTGLLRWKVKRGKSAVGKVAGSLRPKGRVHVTVDGVSYLSYRIIFKLVEGRDPIDQIDHIDMNPMNNSWSNLREATASQNELNKGAYGKVGLKGVSWSMKKEKYQSTIWRDGKAKNLGLFNTAEEAHEAWAKAYREHHGSEFARTK